MLSLVGKNRFLLYRRNTKYWIPCELKPTDSIAWHSKWYTHCVWALKHATSLNKSELPIEFDLQFSQHALEIIKIKRQRKRTNTHTHTCYFIWCTLSGICDLTWNGNTDGIKRIIESICVFIWGLNRSIVNEMHLTNTVCSVDVKLN